MDSAKTTPGRGHLLGARGPRLALVQRHHRDPRLRPAHADGADPEGPAPRRPGAVAASSTRSSTTGSRRAPPPRSSTRWSHYLKAEGALGVREDADGHGRRPDDDASSSSPTSTPARRTRSSSPGDKVDPDDRRRSTVEKDGQGVRVRLGDLALLDREAARARSAATSSRSRAATSSARRTAAEVRAQAARRGRARSRSGDEIEVQLSLRAKHAAEYVHLRDPRGGGLRAGERRARASGGTSGIGWYEEVRDSGDQLLLRAAAGRASTPSSTGCGRTWPAPSRSRRRRCSRCTRRSSTPTRPEPRSACSRGSDAAGSTARNARRRPAPAGAAILLPGVTPAATRASRSGSAAPRRPSALSARRRPGRAPWCS